MQAIFEGELHILGLVGDDELQRERLVHRNDIIRGKWRERSHLRTIGQTKTHADAAIGGREKLLQVPGLHAREAVLGQPFPPAEPWKDHRNASPDGMSVSESAAFAQEKQWWQIGRAH